MHRGGGSKAARGEEGKMTLSGIEDLPFFLLLIIPSSFSSSAAVPNQRFVRAYIRGGGKRGSSARMYISCKAALMDKQEKGGRAAEGFFSFHSWPFV